MSVQVVAIAIGATRQGEDAVLEIEVFNHAHFLKTLGNLLGLFVLSFKRVDLFESNQVSQFDLHGHGAAVGSAAVAQTIAIAGPSVAIVHIDNGDVSSHAWHSDSDSAAKGRGKDGI